MSKNDDKILTLKQKIDERRKEIGTVKRFSPITSCSIELNGQRYNLNVLSKDELVLLCCKLHALTMAANYLKMENQPVISGFPARLWESDIQQKLDIIAQREKTEQLEQMEAHLNKLLSDDKKTELEIDAIEKLLEE